MLHKFTLKLDTTNLDVDKDFDKIANDLYVAGCDDALLYAVGQDLYLDFERGSLCFFLTVKCAGKGLLSAGYKTLEVVGASPLLNEVLLYMIYSAE